MKIFQLKKIMILFIAFSISYQGLAQRGVAFPDSINDNFFKAVEARWKYWDTIGVDKKKGEYKQFNRWVWFWERRVDEHGNFPPIERYIDAWKQVEKERRQYDKYRNSLMAPPSWTELGPTADPPSSGANAGVGRLNIIRPNPSNANEIWVGSASGGLWVSKNSGQTWTALLQTEFMSLGVSDVAIAKSNPNVIYVATGDNDGAGSTMKSYSIGIIKSTDGGDTWQIVGEEIQLSSGRLITRLWVHPNNENMVVAATNKGIMKSIDGGNTWVVTSDAVHASDMEQKPGDPNVLYASTMTNVVSSQNDPNFVARTYILRSTDAGDTWQTVKVLDNTRRTCIEVANEQQPNIVYALSANIAGGFYSLISTNNSGDNWTDINTLSKNKVNYLGWYDGTSGGDLTKGQGFYDLAMAVAPDDPNTIFIGGVNTWRSTNGGKSFSIVTHWTGGMGAAYVHADIHDLKYVGDKLYSAHDGGLDYSTDYGKTWTALNNGLGITQFYKFDNSRQDAYNILAGAQDNGTRGFSNSTWRYVRGGDGMDCAFDPTDESRYYVSIYNGDFDRYSSSGKYDMISPGGVYATFGVIDTGAWVTPLAVDPSAPNNLYIGYSNIYHSNNYGNSWRMLTSNSYSYSSTLRTIKVAPSNGQYIYAATLNGIRKTVDAGKTWTSISSPGAGSISDIAVHPVNADTIYVSYSSFIDSSKVFMYDGTKWLNLSGNLPNVPANTVFYQPDSPDRIYVGTDIGVYYAERNAPYYKRWGMGLPWVSVSEIDMIPQVKKLRVATYGRGVWETAVNESNEPAITIDYEGDLTFCNGDSVKLFVADSDVNDILWSTGETTKEIWAKKRGIYYAIANPDAEFSRASNVLTVAPIIFNALKVTPNKTPEICIGDSVALSAALGFQAGTYSWNTGDTGRRIYVKEPGKYWASAMSQQGCTAYSDTITVNTYPVSNTPTITLLKGVPEEEGGDTPPDTLLVEPEAVKYRWLKNNSVISGADGQRYIPAGSGEYTAQISSGGECWSPLSNTIVGIKEADMQVLSISPNPTKGNIGLTVSSDNAGYYNIVIVDIAGKEVSSIPNASLGGMTYNIDISRFDAGTYFIKLFPLQKGAIITEKIIKE